MEDSLPPGFSLDQPVASAPDQSGGDALPPGFQLDENRFGTLGQQALTIGEGVAKGVAGPLATGAEALLSKAGVPGLSPSEQAGRESENPILSGASEALGFVGPGIATGGLSALARAGLKAPEAARLAGKAIESYSQSGVLSKIGSLAEKMAPSFGIGGQGAGIVSKIGSGVVRGVAENAAFQMGDETSKLINGDPSASVETAIPHIGMAALIGGSLGGGAGAVSSLWKATLGKETGKVLDAIATKTGGIEGVSSNPVEQMIETGGLGEIPPEIRAAASQDPWIREQASTLAQSPTNTGREFQEKLAQVHSSAADKLAETLGTTAAKIPHDFDVYQAGKSIAEAAAEHVEPELNAINEGYNDTKKYASKPLDASLSSKAEAARPAVLEAEQHLAKLQGLAESESGTLGLPTSPAAAQKIAEAQKALDVAKSFSSSPGTTDVIAHQIAREAREKGINLASQDDTSKAVQSVLKDLSDPEQFKTVGDLSNYIKNTLPGKLPFNPNNASGYPMMRAMKQVFRGEEGRVIGAHIGSEEGVDALDRYRALQSRFSAAASAKDALESRVGNLGATSSYNKTLRELGKENGEKVFNRLNGKGQGGAETLNMLEEHFPAAANQLRKSMIEQILVKARDGENISPQRILKGISSLTPQQKAFLLSGPQAQKIEAIGAFVDALKDRTHNYSNTARTLSKLMENVPGAAVGAVSMLLGHNPAFALALGALTKYVGTEAPSAMRLAMLKWLGSPKPIESGAFKTMVDFIAATQKGNSLMDKATKALFSGATKVIPERLMASNSDIKDLDEQAKRIQAQPTALEDSASGLNYYLPNHGLALTASATQTAQHLNALRPTATQPTPLDEPIEPSDYAKAKFNRVLELAQQPMTALHHISQGTLTAEDVSNIQAMTPAFYAQQSKKLVQAMIDAKSKGQDIPYKIRMGVSTFLGQPMDSSLVPQTVAANQASFQANAQQNQQPPQGKAKPSQVGMRNVNHAGRLRLEYNQDRSESSTA